MSPLLPSHKALIITVLLTATTVLLAFNVHLKKKQLREAETYYIIDDEEILEEDYESLDDLLESFDNLLSTNQAVNTSRPPEEFEDDEFRNTMERIQNRNSDSPLDNADDLDYSGTSEGQQEDLTSYESVNDIINLRSANKRAEDNSSGENSDRASTVTYSLVDRTDVYLPPPIYLCESGGKVVISIKVDAKGIVTSATFNNASTSDDGCLVDRAIEYAEAARFNPDPNRNSQLGTITFFFQPKF